MRHHLMFALHIASKAFQLSSPALILKAFLPAIYYQVHQLNDRMSKQALMDFQSPIDFLRLPKQLQH